MRQSEYIQFTKMRANKFIFVYRQLYVILDPRELTISYFTNCQSLFSSVIVELGGSYRSIFSINVVQKSILDY